MAVEAYVAEFLRDAGSGVRQPLSQNCVLCLTPTIGQGAHVKDIAKPTNVDPYKLGMCSKASIVLPSI